MACQEEVVFSYEQWGSGAAGQKPTFSAEDPGPERRPRTSWVEEMNQAQKEGAYAWQGPVAGGHDFPFFQRHPYLALGATAAVVSELVKVSRATAGVPLTLER